MSLREILQWPDVRLAEVCAPVVQITPEIETLAQDMLETMYAAPGIGLAATQVDVHQRVLVLDISETKDRPMALINPEIVSETGSAAGDEGCLSVPEVTEPVERAEHIRVRALDRDGETIEFDAEGLLAICIQHEMDHLEGKLFVDYLSELKRQRIKKKALKQRKRDSAHVSASTPAL